MTNKTDAAFIVQKAIKAFSLRASGYLFGFLFTWFMAYYLGAELQGIFALAFIFMAVGSMVSKIGLDTSLVKWIANSEPGYRFPIYNRSLLITFFNAVVIATLLYFSASYIGRMYDKPNVVTSIRIAAVAMPFYAVIDIIGAYYKGLQRIGRFAFFVQFAKFFGAFVCIVLLYKFITPSTELPITAYLIASLIIALIGILIIRREQRQSKVVEVKSAPVRRMLTESYPMMISSAIVLLMGWSDVFILGFYVSEGEIGVYSTAIKIATLVSFVYNAIATTITPKIAIYFLKNEDQKLRKLIRMGANLTFIVSLPIFLILVLFPDFFLSLFGQEYLIGRRVLQILLIAQLTNSLTGPVGPIFQMTGNQKLLQHYITISLAINIIVSLLLVSNWGMEGVAIGSALGMITWNILGAIYLKKKYNLASWPGPK